MASTFVLALVVAGATAYYGPGGVTMEFKTKANCEVVKKSEEPAVKKMVQGEKFELKCIPTPKK